jgi:hypothetical protein
METETKMEMETEKETEMEMEKFCQVHKLLTAFHALS